MVHPPLDGTRPAAMECGGFVLGPAAASTYCTAAVDHCAAVIRPRNLEVAAAAPRLGLVPTQALSGSAEGGKPTPPHPAPPRLAGGCPAPCSAGLPRRVRTPAGPGCPGRAAPLG